MRKTQIPEWQLFRGRVELSKAGYPYFRSQPLLKEVRRGPRQGKVRRSSHPPQISQGLGRKNERKEEKTTPNMRKFISPCQLTSSLPIVNTLHQRCISTTLRLHQEEPTSSVPKTKDPKGHVLPKRKMPLVKNEKPIRTLFYVPGSSLKMLDKAWTLQPDNIVTGPNQIEKTYKRPSILRIQYLYLRKQKQEIKLYKH